MSAKAAKRALRRTLERKAAGLDGIHPDDFREQVEGPDRGRILWREEAKGAHHVLQRLWAKPTHWTPRKKWLVKKADGTTKVRSVGTIYDDTVVRLDLAALSGVWDTFQPTVLGGRPGVGTADVVRAVTAALHQRRPAYLLKLDVRRAYESAWHRDAFKGLRRRSSFTGNIARLESYYDFQVQRRFKGLVEGVPASPLLLATIMADVVGSVLDPAQTPHWIWLDDLLAFFDSKQDAIRAKVALELALGRVDLQVHPDKTMVVGVQSDRWNFLGFHWPWGWPAPTLANQGKLVGKIEKALRTARLGVAGAHVCIESWARHFGSVTSYDGIDASALCWMDEQVAADYPDAKLPSIVSAIYKFATQGGAQSGSTAKGAGKVKGPKAPARIPRRLKECEWDDDYWEGGSGE